MPFSSNLKKTVHIVSFLLQSLGGSASFFRTGALLYLADLRHLKKFGTMISGDSYLAIKDGMLPINVLQLYKHLKGENFFQSTLNLQQYFTIAENGDFAVVKKYDESYLAFSEVECLFEIIRENKALNDENLSEKVKDEAWQNCNVNAEISLEMMATASGATPSMISYTLESAVVEINAFYE